MGGATRAFERRQNRVFLEELKQERRIGWQVLLKKGRIKKLSLKEKLNFLMGCPTDQQIVEYQRSKKTPSVESNSNQLNLPLETGQTIGGVLGESSESIETSVSISGGEQDVGN